MKILTWNVHGFYSAASEPNFREIMDKIYELDPDIFILQELHIVSKKLLVTIGEFQTEIINKGYTIAISKNFMNCVVSKKEFIYKELDLGRDMFRNVSRNALLCFIKDYNMMIIGTHLDVFDNSGSMRIKQINKILNYIKPSGVNYVIAGDFNSLRRDDYTEEQWNHIKNADRKRMVITKEDVIPILEKEELFESFTDSGKKPPTNTCRYNRRVDYIYSKGHHFTTSTAIENYLSDHFPVIAEIFIF